ncbi:MAG: helix-turn-helix transcriptional regulator [Myxococcota bacterium]
MFERVRPLIKRLAKEQGITYRDIAAHLSISESAVKKTLTGDDCSLNRLSRICELLNVELGALFEHVSNPKFERDTLSDELQEYFLGRPGDFELYWRIAAEGAPARDAAKAMKLNLPALRAALQRLHERGLVRYESTDRVFVGDPDLQLWSGAGPVKKIVDEDWSQAFLRSVLRNRYKMAGGFSFLYLKASPATAKAFNGAIHELLLKTAKQAAADRKLGIGAHLSILVAADTSSLVDAVKAERDGRVLE